MENNRNTHECSCILRLVENYRNTHVCVYSDWLKITGTHTRMCILRLVWKENHGSVSGQITGIFTSILTFFPWLLTVSELRGRKSLLKSPPWRYLGTWSFITFSLCIRAHWEIPKSKREGFLLGWPRKQQGNSSWDLQPQGSPLMLRHNCVQSLLRMIRLNHMKLSIFSQFFFKLEKQPRVKDLY